MHIENCITFRPGICKVDLNLFCPPILLAKDTQMHIWHTYINHVLVTKMVTVILKTNSIRSIPRGVYPLDFIRYLKR